MVRLMNALRTPSGQVWYRDSETEAKKESYMLILNTVTWFIMSGILINRISALGREYFNAVKLDSRAVCDVLTDNMMQRSESLSAAKVTSLERCFPTRQNEQYLFGGM